MGNDPGPLDKALDDLNNGVAMEDLGVDLKELSVYANDHPEIPLAGNLRTNLNSYYPAEDSDN